MNIDGKCNRYMNSDVVGCLNIAKRCGAKIPRKIKPHSKFIKVREILIIRKG